MYKTLINCGQVHTVPGLPRRRMTKPFPIIGTFPSGQLHQNISEE